MIRQLGIQLCIVLEQNPLTFFGTKRASAHPVFLVSSELADFRWSEHICVTQHNST